MKNIVDFANEYSIVLNAVGLYIESGLECRWGRV
jgi:hypothetical protein